MNKIYRSVWNQYLGAWVAAPECARSQGRRAAVVMPRQSHGNVVSQFEGWSRGLIWMAAVLACTPAVQAQATDPANTAGLTQYYWDGNVGPKNDGSINGGGGSWQASAGNNNWSDFSGVANTAYGDGTFAVFAGNNGTVSVDNSQGNVTSGGMRFAVDGYVLQGGAITLTGSNAAIAVGDGSAMGSGHTATIQANLQGAVGLHKVDSGTLVLSGNNTYTGGTSINGGVLSVSSNQNLGAANGGLSFDGGTLQTTASFTGVRDIVFNPGGATVDTQGNTVVEFTGNVTGDGGLHKVGSGTLILKGSDIAPKKYIIYKGLTTISEGTLQFGTNSVVPGDIVNNAVMRVSSGGIGSKFSGVISGSGSLTQFGGSVALLGNNTYTGGTTIDAGAFLQLGILTPEGGTTAGSIVGDVTNNGDLTFARSNTFTFDGVISGSGTVSQEGTGTTVLTGHNTYGGRTSVRYGSLQAGATNTFSANSVHMVAPTAVLSLAGFDQTVAGLIHYGVVNLAGATPGTTLTVNGPYEGNNGVLKVSTVLGADGSLSDRVLLNGPAAVASGSTTIQVVNPSGLGAETKGRGIELVGTANGASLGPGSFSLAGGHIDAGAYEYRLLQDGQSASLHSRYIGPVIPGPDPVGPVIPGPDPVGPVIPVVPQPDPDEPPLAYRDEVPLLSALPQQIRQADLAMLGDLHKRRGDEIRPDADAAQGVQGERRVWGRILRTDPKLQLGGLVNPQSSGHMTGFQAGVDLYADAKFRTGLYVGQLTGDMGVRGFASGVQNKYVGFNDVRTRSVGWYGTWQGGAGFYADLVMQASDYLSSNRNAEGSSSTTKGEGFLTSLELGKAFALDSHWQVEPQAQFVYRLTNLDDSSISLARVQIQTDNDWLLRLGMRVKGSFPTSAGVLQPYGRINVYKASAGTDITRFITSVASTDIPTRKGYTASELAVGATLQTSPAVSLYGELGRVWSSGGESRMSSGLQASLGVKVRW